jgi:transposase-like protein
MCKWCGSTNTIKKGIDKGVQEYLCLECGRKFNEKDAPYGMRTTAEQIGTSLDLYYSGSSLSDIAKFLKTSHNNEVDRSTIYRWLVKFTREAIDLLQPLKPKVSDVWIADETGIKF